MQRERFTIERMQAGEIPWPAPRPKKSWLEQRSSIAPDRSNQDVLEVVGFFAGLLLVITVLVVAGNRWRRRRVLRRSAAAGATVADVESSYETGEPKLQARAAHAQDTGTSVESPRSEEADAEMEEMERNLAYWHWRTQLAPEERKRARTVYIRFLRQAQDRSL